MYIIQTRCISQWFHDQRGRGQLVVACLKRLVAGLSTRRHKYDRGPVRVEFTVKRKELHPDRRPFIILLPLLLTHVISSTTNTIRSYQLTASLNNTVLSPSLPLAVKAFMSLVKTTFGCWYYVGHILCFIVYWILIYNAISAIWVK
jgi:hypothetical protein